MSGPDGSPQSGIDPFEHDDASYLLGTLDRASRAAFEAHLPGCAACTARVAALRPVAGVLTSGGDAVRDALAQSLTEPPVAEPASTQRVDRLAELAGLVERRRRRTRWLLGGLATVAAAAVAALTVSLATPANPVPTAAAQPMTAVGASAIRATAAITTTAWGSEIAVDCSYSGTPHYTSTGIYVLQIVDRSGRTQEIGSWTLAQGTSVSFVGGTALSPDQIRTITVIGPGGGVVLRLSV